MSDRLILNTLIALIVTPVLVMAYLGHQRHLQAQAACESRGGVYVKGYDGFRCVRAAEIPEGEK